VPTAPRIAAFAAYILNIGLRRRDSSPNEAITGVQVGIQTAYSLTLPTAVRSGAGVFQPPAALARRPVRDNKTGVS
jgi:hypothetical protein